MKKYKAIFKTSEVMDIAVPSGEEVTMKNLAEKMAEIPLTFEKPSDNRIPVYLEIEISEETKVFIDNVANVHFAHFGERTYVINEIEFKLIEL